MGGDSERYDRERAFHDERYHDEHSREGASKFYAITGPSRARYSQLVLAAGAGRRVLEYGCGTGSHAFDLAAGGATVTGIDISPEAIARARGRADDQGLAIDFRVMNAESLDLPDREFDLVCGTGILHHLDVERAMREVVRVGRDDGEAVFFEPLGHNPVINLYRRRTPQMRSPDEHPLMVHDLEAMRGWFRDVDVEPYHLAALAAVPLRSTSAFGPVARFLHRIDRAILDTSIGSRWAWTVVIRCRGPRRLEGTG